MSVTDKTHTNDRVLKVPQVAELLQVSKSYCYSLIRRGLLPSFKVGSRPRVRLSDLQRWMDTQVAVNTQ